MVFSTLSSVCRPATLHLPVPPLSEQVVVNGREISREAVQRKYYFALNKPKGFICRWVGALPRQLRNAGGGAGQRLVGMPAMKQAGACCMAAEACKEAAVGGGFSTGGCMHENLHLCSCVPPTMPLRALNDARTAQACLPRPFGSHKSPLHKLAVGDEEMSVRCPAVPSRSNKSEYEDGGEGRLVISLFDDWLARWRQRQARLARGGGGPAGLPPRLFTVGRLDVQSVGLIFVTNDGDWAHK